MTAKLSIDFGNCKEWIPLEKVPEIVAGVTDAFTELGVHEHANPIDFVEVVRMFPGQYPHHKHGTVHVQVVVNWFNQNKFDESFALNVLEVDNVHEHVKGEILRLVRELAGRIFHHMRTPYDQFISRHLKLPK